MSSCRCISSSYGKPTRASRICSTPIQQGILTKSTKGYLKELEATKEELESKIT